MNSLEVYAKRIGNPALPETMKVGRRYYVVPKHVLEIHEKTKQDAFGIGLYLGEEKNNNFFPSVGFLDIAENPEQSLTISKDAEWLFLCGRDVFPKNIMAKDATSKRGLFFVQNELHEIIGIGEMLEDRRSGIILKNRLDRGNFLRREH